MPADLDHDLDLDRYFARIGYGGSTAATLDVIHAIAAAHVAAIPFENLDVLLGRAIDVTLPGITRKLIAGGRGGYCFEQNALMLAVLTRLGFQVEPLAGRVRIGQPRDYTPARTHLFLRVELDGPWLVDVGVGGMSLTSAIRMDTAEPQATPHETRRLVREPDGWLYHQALLDDGWQDVYSSLLDPMPLIDREVGNWYTSAHPASSFKHRLTVTRALPDGGRLNLLNRELTTRHRGAPAERYTIATPDELLDVLSRKFGLVFAPGTRFTCPALEW